MKILAVLLSPPLPATAGHRVRNRSLLQALVLEGHDVTVVTYASGQEMTAPDEAMVKLCRECYSIAEPVNSQADRLRAVFNARPYGALRLTTPAMSARVQHELSVHKYDAVLCDDIYMAGNLPTPCPVPVLLNKHDITCRIVGQYGRSERNPLKKLYAVLEAGKIQRLEKTVCEQSHSVAVCSTRDGELLRELAPKARMVVVPNVIDVEKYTARPMPDEQVALFVGAMDWLPNQDGAEFLVHDILPRLRQLVPTVRVVIAGRNPSPEMVERYAVFPDVSFTGSVVDLRPYFDKASVCVVPLRIGSGTRLKILEAAAMSKPVVSTTLGAEGLELEQGREILRADEPRAFAEAVAMLLKDAAQARAMGRAARAAVEARYSIPALRATLREWLQPQDATAFNGSHVR